MQGLVANQRSIPPLKESDAKTQARFDKEYEKYAAKMEMEQMEGWETYENEEYGFSFRYPPGSIEYEDQRSISYGYIVFFKPAITPLFSEGGHIGNELVTIYKKESALSLEDYKKELVKNTNINTEVIPLTVGGKPAIQYYDEYYSNLSFVVQVNGGFLHIKFNSASSMIVDQILSTFEFVE